MLPREGTIWCLQEVLCPFSALTDWQNLFNGTTNIQFPLSPLTIVQGMHNPMPIEGGVKNSYLVTKKTWTGRVGYQSKKLKAGTELKGWGTNMNWWAKLDWLNFLKYVLVYFFLFFFFFFKLQKIFRVPQTSDHVSIFSVFFHWCNSFRDEIANFIFKIICILTFP